MEDRKPKHSTSVGAYIWTYATGWGGVVTGALTAPCALISLWISDDFAKHVWIAIAILGLWISSFQAWKAERVARNGSDSLLDDRAERERKRSLLGAILSRGNQIFQTVVTSDKQFDSFRRDAESWRDEAKAKILEQIGPPDEAVFSTIPIIDASKPLAHAYSGFDNVIRYVLAEYRKNLQKLIDRYS